MASLRLCPPGRAGNRTRPRPLCKSKPGDWQAGGAGSRREAIIAGGEQCTRGSGWVAGAAATRSAGRRRVHRGWGLPPSYVGLGVPLC